MLNNGMTEKSDENKEMCAITSLYSLLKESKKGDGKSLYWDGKEAAISEDNLDLDNILDGRSVSEGIGKYTADKLIECNYPIGFKQVDIDESHLDCCHFVNGKDEILINRVNYVEEVAHIDEDDNYMEIDFMGIRENRIKYFKNYKTYLGISELSGEKKPVLLLFLKASWLIAAIKLKCTE